MTAIPMLDSKPLAAAAAKELSFKISQTPSRHRKHLVRLSQEATGDAANGLWLLGLMWLAWAGVALIVVLSV